MESRVLSDQIAATDNRMLALETKLDALISMVESLKEKPTIF